MKELKIDIPNEYEIDEENSTDYYIKFKKIEPEFEYVDLGLPSGTLWATCNVGAKKPEELGDCFTLHQYDSYNCPTSNNIYELFNECKWVWCKINDVNGYLVIGINGNHIFLPTKEVQTSVDEVSHIGKYLSSSLYKPHFITYFNQVPPPIANHYFGNLTMNLTDGYVIVQDIKYAFDGKEFFIRTVKNE